jgi:hypothetical protein
MTTDIFYPNFHYQFNIETEAQAQTVGMSKHGIKMSLLSHFVTDF